MPHEGERTVRVRTEQYTRADRRRSETEAKTGLAFEWERAIERGVYAIYDSYAGDMANNQLSNETIHEIIAEEFDGPYETVSLTIHDDTYADARALKDELEDEFSVSLTWGDVLLVGVEEILAQIEVSV